MATRRKHHAPTSSPRVPAALPRPCCSIMEAELSQTLPTPPCSHSLPSLALLRSRACERRACPPWPPWKLRPPQLFSPLPVSSLPTSTALSFAAISFTSCSCSPSQTATVAVEAPAAAAAAGARAWPSRRGPPWAKPSSPAGAQGPPGAPPPLSRRRHGLLRPEQRDPDDLPVQSTSRTSRDNSTKVRGLAAMS